MFTDRISDLRTSLFARMPSIALQIPVVTSDVVGDLQLAITST